MTIGDAERERLEAALGHRFARPELLERAVTHRSWSHEEGGDSEDYERLEFLGDALLGFLVSDRLFRRDAAADEGLLTRRKQVVVREATLAEAAGAIGLGDALRLSRGEEASGGRGKPSLLADVFEAMLGAVYLDGGLRVARSFVTRHLGPALDGTKDADVVEGDFKTRLQELSQARWRLTPVYRIAAASGPHHRRRFRAEVCIGSRVLACGEGSSHKRAEQVAARAALDALTAESSDADAQ